MPRSRSRVARVRAGSFVHRRRDHRGTTTQDRPCTGCRSASADARTRSRTIFSLKRIHPSRGIMINRKNLARDGRCRRRCHRRHGPVLHRRGERRYLRSAAGREITQTLLRRHRGDGPSDRRIRQHQPVDGFDPGAPQRVGVGHHRRLHRRGTRQGRHHRRRLHRGLPADFGGGANGRGGTPVVVVGGHPAGYRRPRSAGRIGWRWHHARPRPGQERAVLDLENGRRLRRRGSQERYKFTGKSGGFTYSDETFGVSGCAGYAQARSYVKVAVSTDNVTAPSPCGDSPSASADACRR